MQDGKAVRQGLGVANVKCDSKSLAVIPWLRRPAFDPLGALLQKAGKCGVAAQREAGVVAELSCVTCELMFID